jgi:hypothetical protein
LVCFDCRVRLGLLVLLRSPVLVDVGRLEENVASQLPRHAIEPRSRFF